MFNRIAGGSKTLRLDACFHLFLQQMRVRCNRTIPVRKKQEAQILTQFACPAMPARRPGANCVQLLLQKN